jgi:hypothetical protein
LAAAAPTAVVAPVWNKHYGSTVDAVYGDRIQADVVAYGSDKKSREDDCPEFEDYLYRTHSAAGSGEFTLMIEKSRPSYTAVYCQGGYWPRADRGRDNSRDGTRMEPDPVPLSPTQQSLERRGIDRVDAAYLEVGRVLYSAEANLSYFSHADEGAYYEAIKHFSKEEQYALKILQAKGGSALPFKLPRPPVSNDSK